MFKRVALMTTAMLIACGTAMAQDTVAKPQVKQEAKAESDMPKLMVGDKAPALAVSKWVKGDAVTGFEKGKVYVVEFWATWCGPCKVSIPHLTELQHENKDVKIIGVSVWESDQKLVEPFVKETGDKMDYTVAMDDVPAPTGEGAKAAREASSNGKMANTWMKASGSNGIPTAFVINGEGKVAWIGHPMVGLDAAIEKVKSGKQDLAADAKEYREGKEAEAKTKAPMRRFQTAMQDSDFKAALAAMDEVVAANPKMAKQMMGTKYRILLSEMKDCDKAYAFGNEIVDGAAKDDPMTLNEIAWLIVDPDAKPSRLDLKLAEKAGLRAAELTKNKDGAILDTVAAVYAAKGDMAKAVEWQEKAVKAMGEDNPQADEIKDRLEKYKKAAKAGGS